MLRRVPTTSDGKTVVKPQDSIRVNKPYKRPSSLNVIDRVQPQRKRKRVSYKGGQADENDSDDDDGPSSKKKKKKDDKDGTWNEEELLAAVKHYPVYTPKPFNEIGGRRFSMPSMRSTTGDIIELIPSGMSLGTRPPAKIIPRPLHDPMEDHAIVLYDPTIDDRETDEERKEREKEEEKERLENEAREKTVGMFNPHKKLKDLLGEGTAKAKKANKIAVVIDPRLTKVLRPHQVEGVKVSFISWCSQRYLSYMRHSSCTNAQPVWWSPTSTDV